MKYAFFWGIWVLALAGCAAVQSNVTTFHSLDPDRKFSGSVYVKPTGNMSPGIEFSPYADRVLAALSRYGFTKAASEQEADYVALLTFAIDNGNDFEYINPTYAQSVIRTTRATSNSGTGESSRVIYSRIVLLTLLDTKAGKEIWEGKNVSPGPSGNLAMVLPSMIDVLLADFPGESGKVVTKVTSLK